MKHRFIALALTKRGIPAHYVAACMREIENHSLTLEVPTAGETDPTELTGGGIQGGVPTPFFFRSMTEAAMEVTVKNWKAKKWGLHVGDMQWTHLWWADNLWLIARSRAMLKAIIHEADEGGFWAEVPSLPGCTTQGETVAELTENLRDAITLWLDVGEDEIESQSTDRILELAV